MKLNLIKETALDMSINASNFWKPERIESISKDWLTMYDELARRNKILKVVHDQMETHSQLVPSSREYMQGMKDGIFILMDNFPELKEKKL